MARPANPHKEKLAEIASEKKELAKLIKAGTKAETKLEKLEEKEAKLKNTDTAPVKKVSVAAKSSKKTEEKVVKKAKSSSKPEEKKRGRPPKAKVVDKPLKKKKRVADDDDDE